MKPATDHDSDVIIIGGGHNGLTCAAYLAARGLAVRVCERRDVVGGAAVTEEFHPGFRNSAASYTVSLLSPEVIRELDLAAQGLRIVERPMLNFAPLADGRALEIGNDSADTRRSLAQFSARDAERLPAYHAELETMVAVLRDLLAMTPPNAGSGFGIGQLQTMLGLSRRWLSLSLEGQRSVYEFLTRPAGDILDGWFEADVLKGVLGFDAIVGSYTTPYAAGSGYVLLHHCFGEVNGKRGVWGHAIGGMGAITQAMARTAAARGVRIEREAEVTRVLATRGRVSGVALADGRELRARAVVSAVHPRRLYLDLIDAADVDPQLRERMGRYRSGSGCFRLNVALSELPRFTARPETGPHHGAGILIAPSLGYLERAWCDARSEGWAREPIIEMLIPSTLDDSLAPPGAHVASLFCQQFAPELPQGRPWSAHEAEVVRLIFATIDRYAPGFSRSVLGHSVLSPAGLEQRFGLVGGDIFHGALSLDQLFMARPLLGLANYRGALAGLYHCGSGAHPGGGVTGLPGRNAAREIARDLC
jgi:phytoene dehydrogenase-like protein